MKLVLVVLGLSLIILMAEARPQEAEEAAAPAAPAAPKRNLRQVMKHSQMTSHKKGEKGLHFCDTI